MEALTELLRQGGPLAYLLLAAAAAAEYVFPPLPGDTVVVLGVFLATTAGLDPWLVYLSLDVGALCGGMAAYVLGRRLLSSGRRPRWLSGPLADRALRKVCDELRRRGSVYLALNRFLPALRAFFFVGAGMAELPVRSVLLWGGLSALAWNGLLLALGHWAGHNRELLSTWLARYGYVVFALLALWLLWAVVRRRRARAEASGGEARQGDEPGGEG